MRLTSKVKLSIVALSVAALVGCSHCENDPLEGYNRQAFYFTEAIDTVAIKPTASVYHDAIPDPAQQAVRNFFGNIADVWNAFNNFLQGRGDDGFSDVSRILVNSFAGLGGLIDVASQSGLPKHNEDLGQTFGVWGIPPGPYFFIPIIGPSTIRDTIAAPADYWLNDPFTYVDDDLIKWGTVALNGISKRAELLDASTVINDAAIDKYEFLRDAYLQRRQRLIEDKDIDEGEWESIKEQDRNVESMLPWMKTEATPSIKEQNAAVFEEQKEKTSAVFDKTENKSATVFEEKKEKTSAVFDKTDNNSATISEKTNDKV